MTKTHWKAGAMLAVAALLAFAPTAQAVDTLILNPCHNVITTDPTLNSVFRNCSTLVNDGDEIVVAAVNEGVDTAEEVVAMVLATCFQDTTPVPLVANCLQYAIDSIPPIPTAGDVIFQLQAVLTWLETYSGEVSAWNTVTAGQTDGYLDALSAWSGTLDDYAIAMNLYLQGEAGYYSGWSLGAFGFGLCQATGPQPCISPGVPRAPGPEPTPQDLPAVPDYTPPPVRTDVPITLI